MDKAFSTPGTNCLNPRSLAPDSRHCEGFTRLDLIATLLMILTLSFLFAPAFARGSVASTGTSCIDNQRRLSTAWQQYAADHSDRLVNNYTIADTYSTISNGQFDTWAHNVLDWSTSAANTNLTYLQNSKLFPYLQGNTLAFKCPSDNYLSSAQNSAQFTRRVRSYSMNAFMGKNSSTDNAVNTGQNSFVPSKRQFLKTASIPNPSDTIVFLDEHPDSINDGNFLEFVTQLQWADLPGSLHNGGCGVGFADGHGEIHTWTYAATKVPVRSSYSAPAITSSTSGDYLWLVNRMTVDVTALALNRRTNGLEIAWSALPTNYVLEASSEFSTNSWTRVGPNPTANFGTKSMAVDTSNSVSFFRLHRF
jgi:prepilin-type processing-associated H-X9-DG protein